MVDDSRTGVLFPDIKEIRAAAVRYAQEGYDVHRINPDRDTGMPTKAPTYGSDKQRTSWKYITHEPHDFRPGDNIGAKLGALSGNIVVADMDSPESILMACRILPPTRTIGHHNEPTHYHYRSEVPKKVEWNLRGEGKFVELLTKGQQVVMPPSVWPTKEGNSRQADYYRVMCDPAIVEILPEELIQRLNLVAGAAYIYRHLPPEGVGMRHGMSLYIAGMMAHYDYPQKDTETMLGAVWGEAGGDVNTLMSNIRTTYEAERPEREGKLRELERDDDAPTEHALPKGFTKNLAKLLGIKLERDGGGSRVGRQSNKAKRLIEYGLETAEELFTDQYGLPFAKVEGKPVPLDSGAYTWLRNEMYDREGESCSREQLSEAVGTLAARAARGGARELHVRAAHIDGVVYVELAPGVVWEIDALGHRRSHNPPVLFRQDPNVKQDPPRLADWAEYAAAVYEGLGWGRKQFLDDWAVIEETQHSTTLEGSPVAAAVLKFMEDRDYYEGSAGDLLDNLKDIAEDMGLNPRNNKAFPQASNWVWKKIQPVKPTLEGFGIRADQEPRGRGSDKRKVIMLDTRGGVGNLPGGASKNSDADPTDSAQELEESRGGDSGVSGASKNPLTYDVGVNSNSGGEAAGGCSDTIRSGENTDPANPASPIAYQSQRSGGSKTDVTDPASENTDPTARVSTSTAEAVGAIAVDLETYAAEGDDARDPLKNSVRLVTYCEPGADPVVVDLHERPEAFEEFLEVVRNRDILGHNLAFDTATIHTHARKRGVEWQHKGRLIDTMILSQVLYAGCDYKHDLASCLKRELGLEISKKLQNSDWSGELSPEQIEYAKNDVRYLRKLHEALEEWITDDLRPTVELETALLPVLIDMKLRGVHVNVEGWEAAVVPLQEEYKELTCELNDKYGVINWNSPKQILEKFKELGILAKSTDKSILKKLAEKHQIARDLLKYRECTTLVQRYGKKWLEYIHGEKLHPDWNQTSTATGRMSCSSPNLQQIPRNGKFRSFFVPSDGKKFVFADYSQIELRIAAKLACDEKMLEAFRERQDLHRLTASMITNTPVDEVTKEQRQLAKALNFGFIFGMGAPRLKDHAKEDYGVELTRAEAEKYRRRWFDEYPKFRKWHRDTEQEAKDSGGKLDMCTFRGRPRYEVKGYSERFNFPVQGSGADGMKLALIRAAEAGLCPVLAVHDEIVCEVDAPHAQEARDELERIMQEAMIEALDHSDYPHVPIEVEPEVRDTWAGDLVHLSYEEEE